MNLLKQIGLQIPPVRRLYDAHTTLTAAYGALQSERDALAAEKDKILAQKAELESALEAVGATAANYKTGLLGQFYQYKACFDAYDVIRRHAAPGLVADPAYLTNYLGVRLDPKFLPGLLDGQAGRVEDPPIPGNWHACMAEWAAALRAVDLAHGRFTVIELGCGWGCWINNTGTAAARVGLDTHLIGIEGDEGHIGFAREACATNGFSPDQVTLLHGIAGARPGVALFPRQQQAGVSWGLEPVFNPSAEQLQDARQSGRFDELPVLALADIAAKHPLIDLLHVDIQGGEADLVQGCLPTLNEKVAYMVIGTHARSIEGRLFDTLTAAGWTIEIERPAILTVNQKDVTLVVDGVQGWRNPALLPHAQPG